MSADKNYVQKTLAGAEYVRYMNASVEDCETRSAYQQLVLKIAPPGGALFDFGAGPGIDTRFFAERGFTIGAYDVDPRMTEYFVAHCRDLIESGRAWLDPCSYREFLSRTAPEAIGRFDLVTSNFAPLNLVDDVRELFAKFHTLTGPQGKVLASVLNPCFFTEMKSRYWWRNAPALWRAGYLFMAGPQAPHYRRSLSNFAQLCGPHFKLTRAYCGRASAAPSQTPAINPGPLAWLRLGRARYMFLLFEK